MRSRFSLKIDGSDCRVGGLALGSLLFTEEELLERIKHAVGGCVSEDFIDRCEIMELKPVKVKLVTKLEIA